MAHWESLPFLVVSGTLACIAVMAIASGRGSLAHRVFGVFLLLVAANFGLDWIAKAFPATSLYNHPAYRASRLFNPFDAAAFLYFASVYPKRRGVARSPLLAGLFIALPLVLFAAYVLLDPEWHALAPPAGLLVFGYFGACYLAALYLAATNLRDAEFASTRDTMRPLVAGLAIAVAPRIGLIESDVDLDQLLGYGGALAVRIGATLLVLVAAIALAVRGTTGEDRAATKRWLAVAVTFVLAVLAIWIMGRSILERYGHIPIYYSFVYVSRWLFFAALVGFALHRHSFLDMDRRLVRAASKLPTLAVAGATFGALFLLLREVPSHDDAPIPVSLVLAGVVSLVALTGSSASGAVRLEHTALQVRKLAAYRALVETEMETHGTAESSAKLHDHRERLGLTTRDHADTVALILAERALTPASLLPAPFELLRSFPSGHAAITALARERTSGRLVVLKTLRPELRSNSRALDAFLVEARALARVRSDAVVRVESLIASPPTLVLEHVAGGTLAERVAARGPLSDDALVRLARDLFSGLHALHAEGILHRDVKPENVLLREDGRAVLADLGASRPMPTGETRVRLTVPGEEVGTVLYMAPEQVRGGATEARTDLYAAAAVLVFAATGRHYLDAEGLGEYDVKRLIVEAAPRANSQLGRVAALVRACLAKDSAARPAGAVVALSMID